MLSYEALELPRMFKDSSHFFPSQKMFKDFLIIEVCVCITIFDSTKN